MKLSNQAEKILEHNQFIVVCKMGAHWMVCGEYACLDDVHKSDRKSFSFYELTKEDIEETIDEGPERNNMYFPLVEMGLFE